MVWTMRLSRNQPCPCHSGRKAKSCCGPWLQGGAAPSPVALMRSRYAAYALGMTRYIMETTDPDGPLHEADRDRGHLADQGRVLQHAALFEPAQSQG